MRFSGRTLAWHGQGRDFDPLVPQKSTVATLARIIGGPDPCCTCLPFVASAFTLQIHSGLGA